MITLTESDARDIADNYDALTSEEQVAARGLLKQYADAQDAKGAPAFPIAQDEENTRRNKFRSAMTVEGYGFEDQPNLKRYVEGSPDQPKARALASSAVFLSHRFDMPLEEVGLKHQELKAQYSLNRWGKVVTDDNAFAAQAKKEVEAEIAVEESVQDAYRVGVKSAVAGNVDFTADYEAWKTAIKDRPGMTQEAFEMFESAYGQVLGQVAPHVQLIRNAVTGLQKNMTGEGEDKSEELIDALIDLDPKDRPLVLRAIMDASEKAGEGVDKPATFEFGLNPLDRDRLAQYGESISRTIGSVFEGMDHQEREVTITELRDSIDKGIELPTEITDDKGATKAIQDAIKKKVQAPEFQSTIDALGLGPKDPALKTVRAPSKAEKALLLKALNREQARIALERQVRQAALSTDPIKDIFAEVIGSSLALMPIMALTARNPAAGRALAPRVIGALGARAVSLPLAAKAYQAMEYDDLMLTYPSLTPAQAKEISGVSAVAMAGLDHFEWAFLKGELPSLANTLNKGVAKTLAGRMGVRLVEGAIFQNVQEGAQDYSTAVWHMIADSVEADMPHRRVAEDWKQWKDSRGKIALGMLPLIFIGAGVGTFKDYKGVASMQSIDLGMKLNGVTDQDRKTVLDFMADGKADAGYAHLRESQVRRKKEIADNAIAELTGQEARELFTLAGQVIGAPTYQRVGDKHIVMMDGKSFTANSWGEARWMMEQKTGGLIDNEILEAQELGNALMDRGATDSAEFVGEDKIADQTVEQMVERVRIQSAAMGSTPEGAQAVITNVLGESILGTKGSVIERAIKIYNRGNVMTVLEEVAEVNILKSIRDGLFTYESLKAVVNNVEAITGRTFIQVDEKGNASEQAILEGLSDMIVADNVGQRKDGTRLPAGTITRGVLAAGVNRIGQTTARKNLKGKNWKALGLKDEPTTTFALFLNAHRHYFKQVFLSARALRKGQKSGALGADYRQFIDQFLGMPAEQRVASEAATEAEATIESVTAPGPVESKQVAKVKYGVVRYAGVTGKLERLGERYVVIPKEGPEVELTGEDFVDVVFETDQETLNSFNQPAEDDGRTGAPTVEPTTGFTPARDGTLSITTPDGRKLVPVKRELSKNVVKNRKGMGFKLKDANDLYGDRVITLYGAEAQQAIEAMLEAADTMETMGRQVSYSVEARPAQASQDADYLAAVEAGDMVTAQAMVDELRLKKRDVFYVGKAEIIRNPSDSDYKQIKKEHQKEYPNDRLGETTRFTTDKDGNRYIWRADYGMHFQIEPGIQAREGVEVGQNEFNWNIDVADPVRKDKEGNVVPLSVRFPGKVSYSVESRPVQQSIRHAALEAKFNDGTINPEETAEAQALVDEAAKAAGYKQMWNFGASLGLDPNRGAFYTTGQEASAKSWGAGRGDKGKVRRVFILSQNPAVEGQNILSSSFMSPELSSLLKERGFDSAIGGRDWKRGDELAVFSQNQIKSAEPFTGVPLDQRFDQDSNNISYSIETRPFTEQVTNVVRQRLDADPALKRAYFRQVVENLAKVQREADSVARRDMTDKEIKDMHERFMRARENEIMNELPADARTEGERRKALKVAREAADKFMARFKQSTPEEKIKAYVRTLSAVVMALNPEDRGKVMGFKELAGITKLDRDKALDRITKAVNKMSEVVEARLVKEYTTEIKKIIARGVPDRKAGKKPDSDVSAEVSGMFELAKKASKWGDAQTVAEIGSREAQLEDDNLDLPPEVQEQLAGEISLIDLIGNMADADSSRLDAILSTLEAMFEEGYMERLLYNKEFDARAKRLTDLFREETGIRDDKELEAALAIQTGKAKGLVSILRSLGHNFSSFNDFLYALAQGSQDSKFAREIIRLEMTGDNLLIDLNQKLDDGIAEFFSSLAGGRYAGVKLVHKLRTRQVTALGGQKLTEMEAAHAVMTWEQPHGKRHMFGEGKSWYGQYTQEWVDDLRSKLSDETRAFMNWSRQHLADQGKTVAALMAERNGVMFPLSPNYFMRTSEQNVKSGADEDIFGGSVSSTATITPPSLRSVSANAVARPVFNDALELFVAREKQVNYWIAKYDFVKIMQRLFLSRGNTDFVQALLGKEGKVMLSSWLKFHSLGSVSTQQFEAQRMLMEASDRASAALILGRFGSLMMQSVAVGAISTKIPYKDFMRLHFKFSEGDLSFLEAWDSEFIDRRVLQRSPAALEAVRNLKAAASPNMVRYWQRHLAAALANTDGATVAINYVIARRYQAERREVFTQQLGEHMDKNDFDAARQLVLDRQWLTLQEADAVGAFIQEAEFTSLVNAQSGEATKPTTFPGWGVLNTTLKEAGILEANRITEEVAQPVRLALKSPAEIIWQNGLTKTLNPFVSDLRQKIMMLWNTATYFKGNKAAAARAYAYVFLVQGLGSYFLRNGWLMARGMDKDDAFDWDNIFFGMVGGLVTGVPGGQALMDAGTTLGIFGDSSVWAAGRRLATRNPADDPVQFLSDMDKLLTATSVIPVVGEYTGPMGSFSHIISDAAKIIDNLDE